MDIIPGRYYNTIIPPPLSAERDNSRQLAGGNARARSSGGIIFYNTFRELYPLKVDIIKSGLSEN